MKYIAIIDDEELKNFRVDVDFKDIVMCAKDKYDCTRGFKLIPLQKYVLVNEDGMSVYLNQFHIDAMRECEEKRIPDHLQGLNKQMQELYERVYMPIGNENLRKRREGKE